MQLRDSSTSQVLYEGDILACVTVARQVGLDKVLFDDAGLGFDPNVFWEAHEQHVAALQATATSQSIDDVGRMQAQEALQQLNALVTDAEADVQPAQQRQQAILDGQDVPPLS